MTKDEQQMFAEIYSHIATLDDCAAESGTWSSAEWNTARAKFIDWMVEHAGLHGCSKHPTPDN